MRLLAAYGAAIFCSKPHHVKTRFLASFYVVGGEGFEPSKAQGQQIYSLSRLTASVSTRSSCGKRLPIRGRLGKGGAWQ